MNTIPINILASKHFVELLDFLNVNENQPISVMCHNSYKSTVYYIFIMSNNCFLALN